jgi:hypothetical protein
LKDISTEGGMLESGARNGISGSIVPRPFCRCVFHPPFVSD